MIILIIRRRKRRISPDLMKKISTAALAVSLTIVNNPCFAADVSGIDKAGGTVLSIVRRIGYWVILVAALYGVIGSIKKQDMKALGHTILFYLIVYAALFFVPWLFRQVEGVF